MIKRVVQLEEQVTELCKELVGFKEEMVQLIEENTRLSLENEQLRKIQRQDTNQNPTPATDDSYGGQGIGHHHLMNLYEEGFHICNVHYGRMRTEGSCLFCVAFLDKTRED